MDQTHLEITSTFIFKVIVFKWQLLPAEESCYQTLNSAAQLPRSGPGYKEGMALLSLPGRRGSTQQDGSFQAMLQRSLDDSWPGHGFRCLLAGLCLLTQAAAWFVQTRATTAASSASTAFANRCLGTPDKCGCLVAR